MERQDITQEEFELEIKNATKENRIAKFEHKIFRDIKFEKNIYCKLIFNNCEFKNSFKYLTFHKKVLFNNCNFMAFMGFEKVNFKDNTIFRSIFVIEIEFFYVNFEKDIIFKDIRTMRSLLSLDFSASTFYNDIVLPQDLELRNDGFIKFCNAIFYQKNIFPKEMFEMIKFDFSNATFKDGYDFSECKFKDISFKGAIFEKNVNFNKTEFGFIQEPVDIPWGDNVEKKEIKEDDLENNKTIDFSNAKFLDGVIFDDSNLFKLDYDFSNVDFKKDVSFKNIEFYKDINFLRDKNELGNIDFSNTTFFKKANFKNLGVLNACFSGALFKDVVIFNGSNFKMEADFNNCVFDEFVSFNDSLFFKGSKFINARFNKGLSLYNVDFKEIPNFGGASLNGSANIANMILAKDNIYELRSRLEDEFEKNHILQNEFDKKLKIINDYRDTFKFLKNGAIKENNNFEANKFHRLELYAREEELKADVNLIGIRKNTKDFFTKDLKNRSDFAQNIKRSSLLIDKQILKFYRILSDHHSSLLKVFNNLIILIALFSISSMFIIDIENKNKGSIKSIKYEFIDFIHKFIDFILHLDLFSFLVICISIYLLFRLCVFLEKMTSKIIDYITTNTSNKFNLEDGCLFITMIVLMFAYFYLLYSIGIGIRVISIYDILVFNFLFVMFYLYLISRIEILRFFILMSSYAIAFYFVFSDLAIISPFFGKILFDNDKFNSNQLILSLSITYTLLMILVLFSLQKTARRNSIMPA